MCKLLVVLLLVSVGVSSVVSQPFSVLGDFSNLAQSISSVANGGANPDFGPSTAFNVDGVISQGGVDANTGSGAIYLASGTQSETQGANDQTSQGLSNSSALLVNPIFATRGSALSFGSGNSVSRVYPDKPDFGDGSTSAFTANTIFSTVGFEPVPQQTSATGSFNSTAEREGISASRAYGLSSTDSATLDASTQSASASNAIGGSDAISIGFNTFAESEGTTFSNTDADSAAAGCEMASIARGGATEATEDAIAAKSNCTLTATRQTFTP